MASFAPNWSNIPWSKAGRRKRRIGRLRRSARVVGGLKRRRRGRKKSRMGRRQLRKIFIRLVRAHLKAKRQGDMLTAGMLAKRIMKMTRRNPKLRSTKAFRAFIMSRKGEGVEKIRRRRMAVNRFDTYSPDTDLSPADSAEGMVIDDPEDFEDEEDEDVDYDMDGFGAFDFRMSQHDTLNRALLIGGYASIAAAIFMKKMKKKQKKQALGAGMALVGAAFIRNMMAKREAQEEVQAAAIEAAGFGDFGDFGGYGDFGDYGQPGAIAGFIGSPGNPAIV